MRGQRETVAEAGGQLGAKTGFSGSAAELEMHLEGKLWQ